MLEAQICDTQFAYELFSLIKRRYSLGLNGRCGRKYVIILSVWPIPHIDYSRQIIHGIMNINGFVR